VPSILAIGGCFISRYSYSQVEVVDIHGYREHGYYTAMWKARGNHHINLLSQLTNDQHNK
jgi:hypothetical protein